MRSIQWLLGSAHVTLSGCCDRVGRVVDERNGARVALLCTGHKLIALHTDSQLDQIASF